jgi:addiction module HigA family antidote
MVRIPKNREPTHPGEMLSEEFLLPMNITQRELADAIHVPYQRVNELVNGKRGITPSTALRLAKYFGVTADFWLNLQMRCDLYRAQQNEMQDIKTIKLHKHTGNAA